MVNDDDDLGSWAPLSLSELTEGFKPADFPWWVAGGNALDLFLGKTTRFHEDTDIEILRIDQLKLRQLLGAWDLRIAQDGKLRPWADGEYLPDGDGSIWCRRYPGSEWILQVLFGESGDGHWEFRRNRNVSLPLEALGRRTLDGIPYLAPAVQLLFKAQDTRPKDHADFEAVVPHLEPPDRAWLISALAATDARHPWLARLRSRA